MNSNAYASRNTTVSSAVDRRSEWAGVVCGCLKRPGLRLAEQGSVGAAGGLLPTTGVAPKAFAQYQKYDSIKDVDA